MAQRIHVNVKVTGRVQGVFYRDTACREARRCEISGWVRNEADGSVRIEAEGEKQSINQFINWCHQGSPWSRVDSVQVEETDLCEFKDFRTLY